MVLTLIQKVFNNLWPMLVVFITSVVVLRFFYLRNHRERFYLYKELGYLFTIVYLWLLFEVLTMTELNHGGGVNLVPFTEILRYKVGNEGFNYNVIGNILIFIPFGYLIGIYIKPKNLWPVIITTLLTSIVVEFVQLQIGRAFDIDDIILNLVGGILGYLIYIGLSAISRHLPDIFHSELLYNILAIIIILLVLIYTFGFWGVIFK